MAEKEGPRVPIRVQVELQPAPGGEKPGPVAAYAYTGTGHFITKAQLDERGNATLNVPSVAAAREVRVVVGPDDDEKAPAIGQLTRRGAVERFVKIVRNVPPEVVTFKIPPHIWPCWLRFCLVEGALLKSITSGGLATDYPVCNATVQIYEVEPIEIILAGLPLAAIEGLRQAVINPPPPPPMGPDDRFPGLASTTVAARAAIGQGVRFARPSVTLERTAAESSVEFANLQFLAQHASAEEFRSAVIANASLIRFIICLLYPQWVVGTLVATATTDRCGNFSALIAEGCYNASVNLYFTATAQFFGITFPIYDPTPISCYTYWNYQCGTKVTLYTNSPFAPTCTPCPPVDAPENYVLLRAIGNVSLDLIYGASQTLAGVTTATNIGLYKDGAGPGIDAPFGSVSSNAIGAILPRIEFDSSLRENNLAMYYQVSYRQGTTGSFTPLIGEIFRHYNHFVGGNLVTDPYPIGPKTVGATTNLFEIPPELPPVGDWAYPNPPYDQANAQFPSDVLPSATPGGTYGLYQLKVDLFDSTGNAVNIATAGIAYFVPTFTDAGGTIHTADASTLSSGSLVSGNSFIMTLRIDNRPTTASLPIPTLNGNSPDPMCGLLKYGSVSDSVTIQYSAAHPANFATYSYRLSRGVNPLTPPTSSGQVSAVTNPATVTMSVSSLLGGCAIAGFGEDVYVAAAATDGWYRLSNYDSNPPPVGFVIAPM
jgi:hypothetical protein